MTKLLQYPIGQKGWTDLRQNGTISFSEQDYLMNILRTQEKFFKDMYLSQFLLQKVIKNALPKSEKPILEGKIPISCQPFDEDNLIAPDEGEILLEIEVPDDQVVTVDYKTWLYLASEVDQAVQKYDSMKDMNKILALPEKDMALDRMTRVYLLDVLDPKKTMNLIPELKLSQVKKAYENANGLPQEIQNY